MPSCAQAHGVVLVYDVTDAQTFENLVGWMKDVDNYCGEEAVKLLIGNKSDQEAMRAVPLEQAKEFAHEHGLLFMEASAKVATNVKAAFRLLVAEVMYKADTLANQPPAFQEKVSTRAIPQPPRAQRAAPRRHSLTARGGLRAGRARTPLRRSSCTRSGASTERWA